MTPATHEEMSGLLRLIESNVSSRSLDMTRRRREIIAHALRIALASHEITQCLRHAIKKEHE